MKKQKGFTLIELLVVIAIIGILSTIVLISISGARNKAANANVKANVSSVPAQIEIFYDTGNTYTGACADTVVAKALAAIIKLIGAGTAACNVSATGNAYCFAGQLKVADGTDLTWCVDSVGYSGGSTRATAILACPVAGACVP